jgi:hypothetical protein
MMKTNKLLLVTITLALFAGCATSRTPARRSEGQTPSARQTPEEEAVEEEEQEQLSGANVQYTALDLDELSTLDFNGDTRSVAKLDMMPLSMGATLKSIGAVAGLPLPAQGSVKILTTRLPDEQQLATFTAYVYAYNMPKDKDLHVLLGSTPTLKTGTTFINVEVSGLPPSGTTGERAKFEKVRKDFLKIVGITGLSTSYNCTYFLAPIAVTVSGGPFWDISHKNASTSSCKDKGGSKVTIETANAWEIHPVTSIKKVP